MDKATAERMTNQDLQIIKAKLEVDKNCDCPDCRDKRNMVKEIERLWETLTQPPVVTDPKPQGEAEIEADNLAQFIDNWLPSLRNVVSKAYSLCEDFEDLTAMSGSPTWTELNESLEAFGEDASEGLELMDEELKLAARVPPEATPSKPADPLHDKILAIKDDMEQSFTSVEHLLESDKNELLEAAKGLIEWFKSNPKSKVGSTMRLVKALADAIEAQEKEGDYR